MSAERVEEQRSLSGAKERMTQRVPAAELVQRARAVSPALRARAERTERERRVPAETMDMLRDADLFRLMQPARFGGFEHGFIDVMDINYELGQGCGSTAWCASFAIAHQWFVAHFPLEAQEEVWRNRSAILAGSYVPNGKCVAAPGGYRLSGGKWPFASNCDNAQWYILGALLPPENGASKPRHAFMLVPREQTEIEDTWFTVGLAGTGSKTVVLKDEIFVPAYRTLVMVDLPPDGVPGSRPHASTLYRMPFFASIPVFLVSPALGIVRGALNEFLESMRERSARGGPAAQSPLAQLPHVQSRIAEASAAIEAARLLLERDIQDVERTLASGEIVSVEKRIRNRRDHAYAARLAVMGVNALFDAVGANGLHLSSGIQRAWRDVNAIARHISLNWDAVSTMYGQHQFGLEAKGNY